MLGLEDAQHRLKYLAFPGLYKPMESQDLSDMLRALTRDHLGYEIGLRDWRQLQTGFVKAFTKHTKAFIEPAHYAQRGQSARTGNDYYAISIEAAFGVPEHMIETYIETSEFWQDLTGESHIFLFFLFFFLSHLLMRTQASASYRSPIPVPILLRSRWSST